MFGRKIPVKKYFTLTSMLILVGFFACIVHIVPQSHHVADAHTEHSNNQVVCVDHQISVSSSSRDHHFIGFDLALPSDSVDIPILLADHAFREEPFILEAPPNKIPIYIKNNNFLI